MTRIKHLAICCLITATSFGAVSKANDVGSDIDLGSFFGNSEKVAAFVHVRLNEMSSNPQLKIGKMLAGNVERELDKLFEFHFGFKASEVESFTYILPARNSHGKSGPASNGIVTLKLSKSSFASLNGNQNKWKSSSFLDYKIFSKQQIAYCQLFGQRMVVGEMRDVKWYLQSTKQADRQELEFKKLDGQIVAGVNLADSGSDVEFLIPKEAVAMVPARQAVFSLDFDKGLNIEVRLQFENELDASNSMIVLQSAISSAKDFLGQQEADSAKSFESNFDNFEFAIENLSVLALIRQGQNMLDQIQWQRTKKSVRVEARFEGMDANLLVISSLAAIQAIGTQAEAKFDDIAGELEKGSNLKAGEELRLEFED